MAGFNDQTTPTGPTGQRIRIDGKCSNLENRNSDRALSAKSTVAKSYHKDTKGIDDHAKGRIDVMRDDSLDLYTF